MEMRNIPYVFTRTEADSKEPTKGLRGSLIYEKHEGDYKGILIGGWKVDVLKKYRRGDGSLEGLCLGGISTYVQGNLKGVNIAGMGSGIGKLKGVNISGIGSTCYWDMLGLSVSGIYGFTYKMKGVAVSGLFNSVFDTLSGLSLSTAYNFAGENGKVALQVGVANWIRDYEPEGTVIQVGLYNRAGDQIIPGINIRGLKNLFKKKEEGKE
jgi:hypothetical protein